MDIITTLFDQDYVTKLYGLDQRAEGRKEGRAEGREEGREEKARVIAKSLKDAGMSLDFIADHTGLTQKEILQL